MKVFITAILLVISVRIACTQTGDMPIDTAKSHSKIFNQQLNKSRVNYYKISGISAFTVGAGYLLHNFQQHAWWSGERRTFHIQNDWAYAMSMDKLGHFFVAHFITNTMKDAFRWSGLSKRTSIWMGALFSIAYMTDIEIEDGFATKWGYSPGDEIFNLGGDIFAVSQDLWKPVKSFSMKWSYFPTNDPNHKGDFPDDYNGQVFWLSMGIHDFLSKPLQKFWPDYLNIALGYGVKRYEDFSSGGRIQNLYLSLDYDVRKIIPGQSSFMIWVKEFINNFRFIPAPALKWDVTNHKFSFEVKL